MYVCVYVCIQTKVETCCIPKQRDSESDSETCIPKQRDSESDSETCIPKQRDSESDSETCIPKHQTNDDTYTYIHAYIRI